MKARGGSYLDDSGWPRPGVIARAKKCAKRRWSADGRRVLEALRRGTAGMLRWYETGVYMLGAVNHRGS